MPSSYSIPPPWRRHHLLLLLLLAASAAAGAGHPEAAPSCPFSAAAAGSDHHHHHHERHHHDHGHGHCGSQHDHDHDHDHDHHQSEIQQRLLPEEMAEEADLELDGFSHGHHHHHLHGDLEFEASPLGVWVSAMGCSLLVSMASLVCLVILPVIFFQGKPSKTLVDALAVFGAGAMLGDAFLHQLPHAFGGEHSHSHDHHDHHHDHGHSHVHSLEDLSIGLSILFGIVLFFIVEKIVRYVEDNSGKGTLGHGHHHHHHKRHNDISDKNKLNQESSDQKETGTERAEANSSVDDADGHRDEGSHAGSKATLRKRSSSSGVRAGDELANPESSPATTKLSPSTDPPAPSSNLVFGYLNLFSDGVHNFTDGMALGSAFLLHGSVGGWSRTLFLLAHELPQEVGDFGILVRSGFTVSKALFFNFLSALVALAGTALALVLGKDPGHSSLIEGFTAGGFVYIAVAGVLPEMNDGKTTLKSSIVHLMALVVGMLVALCISLVE